MNTRKCPYPGCNRLIPSRMFACFPHWRSIPSHLKRRVFDLYEGWKLGDLNATTLQEGQDMVIREIAETMHFSTGEQRGESDGGK